MVFYQTVRGGAVKKQLFFFGKIASVISAVISYKDSFEASLRGLNPGKKEGQYQRVKMITV